MTGMFSSCRKYFDNSNYACKSSLTECVAGHAFLNALWVYQNMILFWTLNLTFISKHMVCIRWHYNFPRSASHIIYAKFLDIYLYFRYILIQLQSHYIISMHKLLIIISYSVDLLNFSSDNWSVVTRNFTPWKSHILNHDLTNEMSI